MFTIPVPVHIAAPAEQLSEFERRAISIGIMDGETALTRAGHFGFLMLFVRRRPRPLANQKLEALRTYAELARVMLPKMVSTSVLREAGFSSNQIGELLRMIRARHRPATAI